MVVVKLILVVVIIVAVYLGVSLKSTPTKAQLEVEEPWWGPGGPQPEDKSIKPFSIDVENEVLYDLRSRLKNARVFTPPLEGVNQEYGFNTNLLKNITDYWQNNYNWAERQIYLNKYQQFTTKIQGLDIHYLHINRETETYVRKLPLLLLHGWPESFRQYYEVIPFLTTPSECKDYIFEIIVPSLPGFGFSQASAKPGLGDFQMAVIFKNLMERLGFSQYYVHGGDWGAMIAKHMAVYYPEKIIGIHSNLCFSTVPKNWLKWLLGSIYPPLVVAEEFEHHMYPISEKLRELMEETGYYHIQATKPDTVGVGLDESPAGLAAYMLEKFSYLTNGAYKHTEHGGLLEKFSYDTLLDSIMIYWITHSMTTSMRIYAESFSQNMDPTSINKLPIDPSVYCACARFKHEIFYQPESVLKEKYTNLVHYRVYDFGGHFIALEEPRVLAEDIFTAVDKIEELRQKLNKSEST